jgi:esterase
MVVSQSFLNGNHWDDWLSTNCPALVIRGRDSKLTDPVQMEEMAIRRPNTSLQTLKGGHVLHIDNPIGFTEAVRGFLESCP